jgi:hypothetical protein
VGGKGGGGGRRRNDPSLVCTYESKKFLPVAPSVLSSCVLCFSSDLNKWGSRGRTVTMEAVS